MNDKGSNKKRILVGMSGGLDSSYAAKLLKADGWEVIGCALRMTPESDTSAAVISASELDIPLHVVDCFELFQKNVIERFGAEYASGRTPNPCIFCNRDVKFDALLAEADALGIYHIATGHYVSIEHDEQRYAVKLASDSRKDQSYMLWRLSQEQLARFLAPLSTLQKSDIRDHARRLSMSSAELPESQEICFIPDGDYAGYLEQRLGYSFPPGSFIDKSGAVLGQHKGIARYTIGQRKHLGIALGRSVTVSRIDAAANTVTLLDIDDPDIYSQRVVCSGLNFQKYAPPQPGELLERRMRVKVRYAAPLIDATVRFTSERAEIILDSPARAITPGQSAVCYDGDTLAFGGYIE